MYPDYTSFEEVKSGVDSLIVESLEMLTKTYSTWESDVAGIFESMGTTVEEFGIKTMPDLYKNISNVYAEEISAKAHTYKFGFLHIHTFGEKYKIGIMNNVKEVEEFIESKLSIDTDIF